MLEKQKRGPFSPGVSVNGGAAEVGRTGLHSAVQQWVFLLGMGLLWFTVAGFQKTAKPRAPVIPVLGRLRLGDRGVGWQELWAVMRWADR